MKKGSSVSHNGYSVEEILAEAKVRRKTEDKPEPVKDDAVPERAVRAAAPDAESIARSARKALNMDVEMADEIAVPPERKRKRKEKRSFLRRRAEEEESIPEDDIYYGLQLKSLDEYRKEYEAMINLDPDPFRKAAPEERKPEKSLEQPAAAVAEVPHAAPQPEPPAPLGEPERTAESPAVAMEKTETISDRQDVLERIMSHAGLKAEDVFEPEDAILKPQIPSNPPRAPKNPTIPPVPPAVEPGPPIEPEEKPPIQEPAPSPMPVAESEEKVPEASVPEPAPEPAPEEAASSVQENDVTAHDETPQAPADLETREKTPGAIREPVAPAQRKDETPAPPAVREPPTKEAPRYRADSLPLHVVELNAFEDALAAEADGYGKLTIHAPEPIPFPAAREDGGTHTPAPEQESAPPSEPVPIRPPETKKAKPRFRLFGSEEDPTPADGPPEEPEEEIEDYSSPGDAPSVLNDLLLNVRRTFLRFVAMCLFTLIAIGYTVTWECPNLLPAEVHKLYTAQVCLIVQLILLTVSGAFCAPTFRNGLRGLVRLQANSDSATAVAALAAAAQNVAFLVTGFPSDFHIYSSLAIFALCLDSACKFSMSKRILRNFRFLTSSEEKYAVQIFDDYNTAIQMTNSLSDHGPKIAYQAKAGFLSHFLRHSYASDPGEHVSQFLAPAGFLGSLALCIAAAVLTKSAPAAFTAFTVSACLCVPVGGALSVSLPLARLSRLAARCGGMTVGWDAVERFSGTDSVMIDAQDLFPRGTVVLNGIQTFAGQRIDEAILDATALTQAVGGTLSDLFSQIVKTRGEELPHVERPVYEEDLGISGTVSDRIILIGTGELLKRHGVDAPSHDYEEKYRRAGKVPIYLASGGLLVAMFLVFYRSDRRRASELHRLEANGITLLVRTLDPNITPDLIAGCFGLSRYSVSVLPKRLGDVYASLQADPPERASAVLATKGRAFAMMRLLTACSRQRSNITIGVALQTAGAALGFALAAFFTACGGLRQLSATALLLFEAFWALAVALIPRIRKP
jgi:hypothetical protein